MKIGVVSDSHGEIKNLEKAAQWLINTQNVDVIVHLGDNYDDALFLEKFNIKIIKVPGVFSSYYQDITIPNRVIKTFSNRKVLISHTVNSHENDLSEDLKPEELIIKKKVEVILYGHSHIPQIEHKNGIWYINPGHLKTQDKKKYPPTIAVVSFNNKMEAKIFKLSDGSKIIHKPC